jgi:hypothetical protein
MRSNSSLALAMYKPTEGNAEKLKEILKDHIPTLRKYELIADGTAYMVQSADGTIIEVFEWINNEAKNTAHEHPAIRTIWGKMEGICEFPGLQDLPEAKRPFPNFEILSR